MRAQGAAVRSAARVLAQASDEQRTGVLVDVAERLIELEDALLEVNAAEVADYAESGPGRDRLTLTPARVAAMATALRDVAAAPDPLEEVVDRDVRPNGLRVEKMRVPLGVIGVVYENRPNVTCDVAGLCVRSGNAAYLRGSASARRAPTPFSWASGATPWSARACRATRSPWSRTPATRRRSPSCRWTTCSTA